MSNSIAFVGRLAADAELKHVGDNDVLEFRVANNTGFGDKQVTNWFKCSFWGRSGSKMEPHMTKGKQVFITGELSLRSFTTREGAERLSPEIRVSAVDFVGGSGDQSAPRQSQGHRPEGSAPAAGESEEDLPF